MEKLAAIDLGSNSIRMSIFEIESQSVWHQTGSFRRMIKLSEGMTEDMNLQPAAQLRAVTALLEYKQIIESNGITSIRAVATAAVRKAKNGREFVETVKDTTGITIEVIDGEAEAALDCLAAQSLLGCQRGIICDIGGGSTEFIAINKGTMLKPVISIPMGSRSITEVFLSEGEAPDSITQANSYIHRHISQLPWLDLMEGAPIIGIGGTLRALAKYHMKTSSKEPVSHYSISATDIDLMFEEISSSSLEQRRKMPGIGNERADIILGGLLPLMQLKSHIGSPQLIVADVGVREGILFDFLERLNKNE